MNYSEMSDKELLDIQTAVRDEIFRRETVARQKRQEDKWKAYQIMCVEISLEEPEWPSMGESARNGFATLVSEEQFKKWKSLRRESYEYNFVLEWNGPGDYIIEPEWEYDRDKDIIYTGVFKKV